MKSVGSTIRHYSPAVVLSVVLSLALMSGDSYAKIYRVGNAAQYQRVSDCAGLLKPGDIVEVTGDITDRFTLTAHGTPNSPVILRGITRTESGKIVRPRITIPYGASRGIVCKGNWNIIEGLDISGARGDNFESGTAIKHACDNLVLRNCRIHNNRQGVFGDFYKSGSILIEFCEFDSNGGLSLQNAKMHSVYLCSMLPNAKATIRFCWFHDATGGALLKSRCARNAVLYNWFENQYFMALQIVDTLNADAVRAGSLYPMHTDIVGNVFFPGWSPGSRWAVLSLGGESSDSPGTEGVFSISHNLFVAINANTDPSVAILVHGNVDRVVLYNNVFIEYGIKAFAAYSYLSSWTDARSQRWTERRGSSKPLVEGTRNWISHRAIGIPDSLSQTLRGMHPCFVDLLDFDFRPTKDSPLVNAGLWPLPKGQLIDLAPEYEPQRGIPPDLKPIPRRKTTPPSIGPFEISE